MPALAHPVRDYCLAPDRPVDAPIAPVEGRYGRAFPDLPALDALGLAESDRLVLAELLSRSPQVRRVVAGHVHRTVFGTVGGCAVVAYTSCHEQALLEFGAQELAFVDEPPAYAVHAAVAGGVVSHIQPIS